MGGTGYALYKKPKNGIAVMLVSGGAGTFLDLAYGWTTACRPYVAAWKEAEENLRQEKHKRSKADTVPRKE